MTLTLNHSWPDTLPLPLLDFSASLRTGTLVDPADQAFISRRSRFNRFYRSMSAGWVLNIQEFDAFKTFFNDEIGNGAALFRIELRYPKNSELTQWAVRFGEDGYEAQQLDGNWSISANLDLVLLNELAEASPRAAWTILISSADEIIYMLTDQPLYVRL